MIANREVTASFRGVEFLVSAESVTVGRKIAVHEYPNRNTRFVQDLGLLPNEIVLSCLVHGRNSIEDRDNIIRVMQQAGRGLLVTPFFGEMMVTPRPTTITHDKREQGVFYFTISFLSDSGSQFPTQVADARNVSASQGDQIRQSAAESLTNVLTDNLFVPVLRDAQNQTPSFASSISVETIEAYSEKLTEVGRVMRTTIGSASSAANNVRFENALNNFTKNIQVNLRRPESISSSITSIFSDLVGLPNTDISSVIDQALALSRFGRQDPVLSTRTLDRRARVNVTAGVNDAVRVMSLASAYQLTAQRTFSNTEELEAAASFLDESFTFIESNSSEFTPALIALSDQKSTVSQFLRDQRVTTPRIENIDVRDTPSSVLAYQLYEDTSLRNNLASLNRKQNAGGFSGDTRILTNVS